MSMQDRYQRYAELDKEYEKRKVKEDLKREMWSIYGKKKLNFFDRLRLKKIHKQLSSMD